MPSSKPRMRTVGKRKSWLDAYQYVEWLGLGKERRERNVKRSLRRGRLRYSEDREKFHSRERYIRHRNAAKRKRPRTHKSLRESR